MSIFNIIQEDIKKEKTSTTEKKIKDKEKKITGVINIAYSFNAENQKYSFLYSVNNQIKTLQTKTLKEGLEKILDEIRGSILKPESNNNNKKSTTNSQKNIDTKTKSLF